jgi:hypothetical protein
VEEPYRLTPQMALLVAILGFLAPLPGASVPAAAAPRPWPEQVRAQALA